MQNSSRRLIYPDTRTVDAVDTLAGINFPDPYRWLEQNDDEVRSWQRAQAELASAHVREWPSFEQLRGLVTHFSTERFVELPRYAAGHWFRKRMIAGASHPQVIVADAPFGEGRVLFDPDTENVERPPFLSWISPSPDGKTLALGICSDGSENNHIQLIDVSSGRALAAPPEQTLMDNWTGGAQWLPDSSGFFFSAIMGSPIDFDQRVFLHHRVPMPTTECVDIPWSAARQQYRMVVLSCDERYAVAIERITNPIPVAVADLKRGALHWRPFVTSIEGTVAGHVVHDRFVAVTDVGAPRGRLVSIPLDAKDPNDPKGWTELVGESAGTLRTVTPVGETLYLTEIVDTYARVRIVDFGGKHVGEVPLPGRGALGELPFPLMNLIPIGDGQQFLFGFSSLTTDWGVFAHIPTERQIRTLRPPTARLSDVVVEDRWATSADGTGIPFHIVRRSDLDTNAPRPTLIYAYGGWNVALLPQFPGPMAAFVAAGGVFVHAHLRGGGEFGLEWRESGRRRKKQNGYDDLYAIAESLIAAGACTPQMLAVVGGSNGGTMAAVAMTQRPDLWKVVVPRVPLLDLIGACRECYGRNCVAAEFADVDNPEEVRRLAKLSPYHSVREGTQYPAVYIDVGDTDPRSPPWSSRKFAARLQKATSGSAPVLLHVWENVGHGWATDKEVAVLEHTEWLAFTLRHLGVSSLPSYPLR